MSKEMLVELNKRLLGLKNEAKTLTAEMERKYKEDPTGYTPGEYTEKLTRIQTDADPIVAQIKALTSIDGIQTFTDEPVDGLPNQQPGTPGGETRGASGRMQVKDWGTRFIESQEFKSAAAAKDKKTMPFDVKAQYAGSGSDPSGLTGTHGGHLIEVDRLAMTPDLAPLRPRTIMSVIGMSTTNSDRVEYPRITTKTNNADVVPERNVGNTDFATKPQSEMLFDLMEETVRTIAHWIPASRQILQDAQRLRGMINTFLTEGLEVKVEDLVVNGTGTGNEWTGLLAGAGQTRVHATSGRAFNANDNIIDTIRRAITDIRLTFLGNADFVLLHPTQAETLELLKDDNKNYMNVFDPLAQRVWRIPVVESQVIAAGTGLVGNGRMGCTLWDRMMTEVRVGEPNDYFIKNAIAVLAELRCAFGIIYEDMFEKITNLP